MKNHYILVLLATFALLSGSIATGQDNNTSKPARLGSLPDNPCELLTQAQMSAITGLEVTSVQRVRGIVDEHEIRDSDPGRICIYQTQSEFGAITIVVPARAEQRSAVYWEKQAKYFKTFPGSAKGVADLGMDAWVHGGATAFSCWFARTSTSPLVPRCGSPGPVISWSKSLESHWTNSIEC